MAAVWTLQPDSQRERCSRRVAVDRLAQDLSQVRIHDDGEARRVASAHDAQAYTWGRHVVWAASERPESASSRPVPQFQKAKKRTWKGAYLDEKAVVEYLKKQGLSEKEAKKRAPEAIAKLKKQGELIVAGYPGLKDQKFDYDLFQDVAIGADRQPPNCFGDVCKGGKQRWEPDQAELAAWLNAPG